MSAPAKCLGEGILCHGMEPLIPRASIAIWHATIDAFWWTPVVSLDSVSKSYGGVPALAPLTMELARERVTALIGPSGCGKSTLLRMIVGLVVPDAGRVVIGGETLTNENVARLRHGIGYVIQEGGLFPHLNARENVTL